MDTRLKRRQYEYLQEIETSFARAKGIGVLTSKDINMPATFSDANILREAALFLQRQGATTMTVKDTTRTLHKDILITEVLQIADDMGLAYLALWEKRENKVAALMALTDADLCQNITWDSVEA